MQRFRGVVLFVCLVIGALAPNAVAQQSFIEFESGPVRPLALSPDRTKLFAVNTPDGRLEVFNVGSGGVALAGSVDVGLEPVAVAARSNTEVWVVNHLSDSVSIVDVSAMPPRVVRTLLVGDEPRDIVFAGAGNARAFITTAHRGQQRLAVSAAIGGGDPQLTTAGVGRADVWVFDAANLGTSLGGDPVRIVTLFADTPRALAVSPNGSTVYAAAFHSGNQTSVASEGIACGGFVTTPCNGDGVTSPNGLAGGQLPGGTPGPGTNAAGDRAPHVGVVVKYDAASGQWRDGLARNWSNAVRFNLPDKDVFAIDATTLSQTAFHAGVGTILFNMVANPVSGKLYVSNTESNNATRFEGPGVFGGSTVQGHLAESRITVISNPGTTNPANVAPRRLNKHINYSILASNPSFDTDAKNHSLATPTDMAIDSLGSTLYVAAFGSSKIGVFPTSALEDDSFVPTTASANYIQVSGGGPAGLALDESRARLYVLTRFDNAVKVVDLATRTEVQGVALHNPEPPQVVQGRPFLYDAFNTSANGEASCSSCHVFGDLDSLAWDLGNPDDVVTKNPIPINLAFASGTVSNINGTGVVDDFHPMKGPMTTQTLRGLSNSGAMHWRGDRANGFFGLDSPYVDGNEDLSFRNFIVAFPGLVGRATPIASSDMQKFTDFALRLTLPPNPVRSLDNTLNAAQQAGKNFYSGTRRADGAGPAADSIIGQTAGFTCNGCHTLDPSQGFFGTGARASFENEKQIIKIPHLRNLYQKVGMFGMPNVPFNDTQSSNPPAPTNAHQGDQIRGFGFLHDGSTDTLFRFFHATVFANQNQFGAGATGFPDQATRLNMEQFMLAFDSDLPPIVGQQVTLTSTNSAVAGPRIDLLNTRAATAFTSKILGAGARECDVIVKGRVGGREKGWVRLASGNFQPDDGGAAVTDAALRALAATPGQELTYTAVPYGSGQRAGVNRDEDGFLDGVDNCPAVANNTQRDGDGDLVGDDCDNCAAKANADQSDVDADGIGDACDNLCVGTPTTLTGLYPGTSGPVGAWVQLNGTGFGPNRKVFFDATQAVTQTDGAGNLLAQVPSFPSNTVHTVTVVNPEGCQSQEAVTFKVRAPSSCGLLGIEPIVAAAGALVFRRNRRGTRRV